MSLLVVISSAAAQPASAPAKEGTLPLTPPPPPPPLPPPPAAEAGPPAQPPAQAPPATTEAACVPSCRSGYLCNAGQCVSACNPPCQPGEQCAANGECAMDLGGVSYPNPPARTGIPSLYQGAAAIPPPPDPGKERHDGFMLRLALGFGSGVSTIEASGNAGLVSASGANEKLSGVSGSFSFDVGASPIDNLVIHARLADMLIINPSLRLDGRDQGTADNSNLVAVLYAVAVSYYFMPLNLYVTGALGPARIGLDPNSGPTSWSKFGFGMNIDVGKEWWVGDNWGLGVAARFWYAHTTDQQEGLAYSYNFTAWALMFSATYQ